jgi:hypothetical protein
MVGPGSDVVIKKSNVHIYGTVAGGILAFIMILALLMTSCSLFNRENGIIKGTDPSGNGSSKSVGIEVYDLTLYEESTEEYYAALGQMEEDWFPRQAVVIPKGPEGGDYPNAPAAIYDAFPGQQATTEEGETYEITRTWIGDIAVGTEVNLEGVVGQGEWCFVTGETIGGWSSSGWVWCYRLNVPDDTWVD